MPTIFVVVLRISVALGYAFDECAARVEFESAVDIGRQLAIQLFLSVLVMSRNLFHLNIAAFHN
jgi:hypothetical protein